MIFMLFTPRRYRKVGGFGEIPLIEKVSMETTWNVTVQLLFQVRELER